VLTTVQEIGNPVLRLRTIDALASNGDRLREMRMQAMRELRSEDWGWSEIGEVTGTTKQRAWQIAHGQ